MKWMKTLFIKCNILKKTSVVDATFDSTLKASSKRARKNVYRSFQFITRLLFHHFAIFILLYRESFEVMRRTSIVVSQPVLDCEVLLAQCISTTGLQQNCQKGLFSRAKQCKADAAIKLATAQLQAIALSH